MILQIFSNRYHNYTHLMNGTTNTLQEAFCNIILLKPAPFLSIFKATRSLPNNFLMPNLFQLGMHLQNIKICSNLIDQGIKWINLHYLIKCINGL